MSLIVSPLISRVEAPPITEAMTWVRPGARNREPLDLRQAVPSYAPSSFAGGKLRGLGMKKPGTHLYTDIDAVPGTARPWPGIWRWIIKVRLLRKMS